MPHHHQLPPRAQAALDRLDAWADRSAGRAVAVRAVVTVAGPLVVLAGVAMLVLPGPGLLVIAVGTALLALEYQWARTALAEASRVGARLRRAAFPRDGSAGRRLLGLGASVAVVVATTALTGVVTTYVGSQAFG